MQHSFKNKQNHQNKNHKKGKGNHVLYARFNQNVKVYYYQIGYGFSSYRLWFLWLENVFLSRDIILNQGDYCYLKLLKAGIILIIFYWKLE